jgi:hypothetical protein
LDIPKHVKKWVEKEEGFERLRYIRNGVYDG